MLYNLVKLLTVYYNFIVHNLLLLVIVNHNTIGTHNINNVFFSLCNY